MNLDHSDEEFASREEKILLNSYTDDDFNNGQYFRVPSSSWQRFSHGYGGAIAWLGVILLLCSNSWLAVDKYRRHNKFELGGDTTGLVPKFSQEERIFTSHSGNYATDPFNVSEAEVERVRSNWKKLFPAGEGFLDVTEEEVEKFGIPTKLGPKYPEDLPKKAGISTGVAHQLHCIWFTQEAHFRALRGEKEDSKAQIEHFTHCIEYLAQAIVCFGDTSMDYDANPKNLKAKHVCKNHKEMMDYFHSRRIVDEGLAWDNHTPL